MANKQLKEIEKMNYNQYKESSEYYKKLIKKFLKQIPKTDLIQYLKELKIIKVDYLTGEVTECQKKS